MKNLDTLYLLFKATSSKHRKFNRRLLKGIDSGEYYKLSPRKQRQAVKRVKKFRTQLKGLYMKLAMAGVSGFVLNQATVKEVKSQELGPFNKVNRVQNPLRAPLDLYSFNMIGHALGDIDQDGDIDLLVGYYDDTGPGQGFIRTFKNFQVENGATKPQFQEVPNAALPYTITNDDATFAASFVDLDGDGLEELAIAVGYYQPVEFLQNNDNGTGDFTLINTPGNPLPNLPITADDYTSTLVSVDIDNDGDLDIFQGTTWALSGLYFWINDGTNNFTNANHSLNDNGMDYGTPAFIDIDNDGDQDLFMGDNTGVVHFFLNQESGGVNINPDNFLQQDTSPLNFLSGIDFGSYTVPRFVDLDMDGDQDMVLSKREAFVGPFNAYLHVFYNDGSNSFTEATGLDNPFGGIDVGTSSTPAIVDIDNDGDNDLFLGSFDSGFTFYENTNNVFQRNDAANQLAFFNISYPSPGYDSTVVEFADFDQDGDLDGAFVGTLFDDKLFYFRNNGTIETTESPSNLVTAVETAITFQNRELHTALGDIDGDGDLDALVAGIGTFSPPMKYFENTGGEVFSAGVNIFAFGDNNPDLVDIDHDGDADLFLGEAPGSVRFFLSDGTTGGDVTTMVEQTGASNPLDDAINTTAISSYATPEFGDLDGDGDQDYVQGLSNGQVIYVRNENQPPTLSITLDPAITFTEQGAPVALTASTITPGDPDPVDNTNWIEVIMRIQNPVPGDLLTEPAAIGITPTWDAANFQLILSGYLDRVSFTNLIQDVTFNSTSDNPGSSKTIEYWITDDDGTIPLSAAASVSIPIVESNDAPVVVISNAAFVYTENDPPIPITSNMSILDPDDLNMEQATIAISSNYIQTEDLLSFTDQNGITGSYDAATGTMTLSGSATIADYLTAIESVTYQNTSEDPDVNNRTISITVFDGSVQSNTPTITATIISVNDSPIITGSGVDKNYSLSDPGFIIDDQITVTDPDDINVTSGTVEISANYQQGVDLLSLGSTNGITGTFDDQTGVLTLSGTASLSNYTDAFRTVTYFNQTDGSQTPKTISFSATDPNGATSLPYSVTVNLGAGSVDANPVNTNATIGDTTSIDVISAASVDPADVITTTIVTNPTKGSATVNASQEIEYTPNNDSSGTDQIEYQLCNETNSCDIDFVNITIINNPPVVNPPDAKAPPGGTATIDLTTIISDDEGNIDPNSLQIISQPTSGALATIDGSQNLIVDYSGLTFTGVDRLTIEVCDLSGECTQTEIEILVGNVDGVTVYNALSPNGDGLQDFTRILDIEFFPENTMVIYNRMGNKVWEANNYNNTTVIFEGLDDNGNELPNGTYYYTLELINSDGEKSRQSGYIVLNR